MTGTFFGFNLVPTMGKKAYQVEAVAPVVPAKSPAEEALEVLKDTEAKLEKVSGTLSQKVISFETEVSQLRCQKKDLELARIAQKASLMEEQKRVLDNALTENPGLLDLLAPQHENHQGGGGSDEVGGLGFWEEHCPRCYLLHRGDWSWDMRGIKFRIELEGDLE